MRKYKLKTVLAIVFAAASLLQVQTAHASSICLGLAEKLYQSAEWIAEFKVLQASPLIPDLKKNLAPTYFMDTSLAEVKIERIYKNSSATQETAKEADNNALIAKPFKSNAEDESGIRFLYKNAPFTNAPLRVGEIKTIFLLTSVVEYAKSNNMIGFFQNDRQHNQECPKALYRIQDEIVTVENNNYINVNVLQFLQNKVK